MFLKYGRRGKPHNRFVWWSNDALVWCKKDSNGKMTRQRRIELERVSSSSKINLLQITDVAVGANATEVLNKNKVPLDLDDLLFSIISEERSLDLQAKDKETRNMWVK